MRRKVNLSVIYNTLPIADVSNMNCGTEKNMLISQGKGEEDDRQTISSK